MLSPVTFQLKPNRGENCTLPLGTSDVFRSNVLQIDVVLRRLVEEDRDVEAHAETQVQVRRDRLVVLQVTGELTRLEAHRAVTGDRNGDLVGAWRPAVSRVQRAERPDPDRVLAEQVADLIPLVLVPIVRRCDEPIGSVKLSVSSMMS